MLCISYIAIEIVKGKIHVFYKQNTGKELIIVYALILSLLNSINTLIQCNFTGCFVDGYLRRREDYVRRPVNHCFFLGLRPLIMLLKLFNDFVFYEESFKRRRSGRAGLVSDEQSILVFNSSIILFQTLPLPPSTPSNANLRDFQKNSHNAMKNATDEPIMRTTKIPPTFANPSSAADADDFVPSSCVNNHNQPFLCEI
jgi:hypothetical protein